MCNSASSVVKVVLLLMGLESLSWLCLCVSRLVIPWALVEVAVMVATRFECLDSSDCTCVRLVDGSMRLEVCVLLRLSLDTRVWTCVRVLFVLRCSWGRLPIVALRLGCSVLIVLTLLEWVSMVGLLGRVVSSLLNFRTCKVWLVTWAPSASWLCLTWVRPLRIIALALGRRLTGWSWL